MSTALELFRFASTMDEPSAQNNYGVLLAAGYGGHEQVHLGIKLIEQAAEKQNPAALDSLSFAYTKGIGVERDRAKALLYKKSEGDKHKLYLNISLRDAFNRRELERIFSEEEDCTHNLLYTRTSEDRHLDQ